MLVEVIRPVKTIAEGVRERFASATALLVESLAALGIAARVGALPGEYCAGDWSVNAAGVKLAGTAQRTIKRRVAGDRDADRRGRRAAARGAC